MSNNYKLTDVQKDIVKRLIDSLIKYNEAGIEGFTSIGKSVLAVEIIKYFMNTHKDKMVLWIGPKAANDNVRTSVIGKYASKYEDDIKFVNYQYLAALNNGNVPSDIMDDVGLIVFDECHSALAAKTFVSVSTILNECHDAWKLAMTATSIRDSDNVNSLSKLVPEAYKNRAIVYYGLTKAIENKLVNELEYRIVAKQFNSFDITVIKRLETIGKYFDDTRDRISQLLSSIDEYNKKSSNRIAEALKDKLYDDDANVALRHIVFFSKINELEASKELITNAFQQTYPKAKIRVWEFHNKNLKESKTILKKAVASKPEKGTVDVILTVNKGIESIHPKGIKSVVLLRGTASNRVYTQEIGRLVSLKDFSENEKGYIFDFCDNLSMLHNMTIGIGVNSPADRGNFDDERELTFEEMCNIVQSKLKKEFNIVSVTGTSKMMQVMDEYIKLNKICRSRQYFVQLITLKNRYIKNKSIKDYPSADALIEAYKNDPNKDEVTGVNIGRLEEWLGIDSVGSIRSKVLNGAISSNSEIDIEAIKELGHTLFLRELDDELTDDKRREERYMTIIDRVKSKIDSGTDIQNLEGSLAEDYKTLARAKCASRLSTNVAAYARFIGVEIRDDVVSGNYISAYKNSLSDKAADELTEINKRVKNIPNLDTKEKRIKEFRTIIAKIYHFKTKYPNKIASDAIASVIKDNKVIFDRYAIVLDSWARTNPHYYLKFALMCHKMSDKHFLISGEYQTVLMRHWVTFSRFSDIEQMILLEFGLNSTWFKEQAHQQMEWIINVDRDIDTKNIADLKARIAEGKRSGIDYWVMLADSIEANIRK